MSSVCKSAAGCVADARLSLRSSYVNLHKWAESDAEFIRSVAAAFPNDRAIMEPSHRQIYLRSYTFSKKETVPEKTVKCFGKVKEKAADFAFIYHRRKDSNGSFSSFVTYKSCAKKKKKKGCSIFYSIFRRLLSCTMSVDVAEADSGATAGGSSHFGY